MYKIGVEKDLEGQIDLLLAFELQEHGDHVHLQEPGDVGFDEYVNLLFVIFQSLQAHYHGNGFFADQFFAPP